MEVYVTHIYDENLFFTLKVKKADLRKAKIVSGDSYDISKIVEITSKQQFSNFHTYLNRRVETRNITTFILSWEKQYSLVVGSFYVENKCLRLDILTSENLVLKITVTGFQTKLRFFGWPVDFLRLPFTTEMDVLKNDGCTIIEETYDECL